MKVTPEQHLLRGSIFWPGQQPAAETQVITPKARPTPSARLTPEERNVERVLAMARALLVGSLLTTIYLTPQAINNGFASKLMLLAYCVYSLGLIVYFRKPLVPTVDARNITHFTDVFWAGGLLLVFSHSPYNPVVVFLIFPLLAAAMRWGFRGTMITAMATSAMLLFAILASNAAGFFGAAQVNVAEQNRFWIGSVYVLGLGCLLGYLGEHERRLRSEAVAIARVASHAHKATTPNETVTAIFDELFEMFDPAQVQLAIHEIPTGRIHVWESNKKETPQDRKLLCRDLDFSHREELLFENPEYHLYGTRNSETSVDIRIFDDAGKPVRDFQVREEWFPSQFHSFMSVPIVFGSEWEVRLFVWNPHKTHVSRSALRSVADVANRLSPAIFTAALQQHLRSRATAEERARFARELHDGIMQSLVALDLKIEVLKKICGPEHNPVQTEVSSIQRILRSEVMNLRELIQQTRRIEISPTQLLTFLSNTVSTFQRETGITARFISELEEVNLSPVTCYEVARIVQESLTNVRKHSGARNVIVRFAEHMEKWILVITDDGRGFNFVGQYTLAELDEARKGPAVIKERVRSISGTIRIESGPEKGARLEITFPKEQR